MARRIHIPQLSSGTLRLEPAQAHHVRDVLRLDTGAAVELFDNAGHVALAQIVQCDSSHVSLEVGPVRRMEQSRRIVVASAVPKGDRADWMVEKLSELGVSRFIPLRTERSVVHPEGTGKLARWKRIATESAKQSRRTGVLQIDELAELQDVLKTADASESYYLSTEPHAAPILGNPLSAAGDQRYFIGPEGGWTDAELALFQQHGLTGLRLTATILRIETAAVAVAVIAACGLAASCDADSRVVPPPA